MSRRLSPVFFMSIDLESIATLPGIQQAAIGDDAGRLLGCAGHESPPTAAILVLAHATLAAAAELGRRSGAGDCVEVIQHHEGGCICLHSLPGRRVLLVRCRDEQCMPAVRAACRLAASRAVTEKAHAWRAAPAAVSSLSAAFHAEPAW